MDVTLLFPGQGAQYVGMGSQIFATKRGERLLEEAEDALSFALGTIMTEGPKEELTATAIAQPAIVLHSIAAFSLLQDRMPVPVHAAIGHSLGEYSALVAAGVLSLSDALKAVHARGRFMQEAAPKGSGAMAAVLGMDAQLIMEALEEFSTEAALDYAAIANFNGPSQTVIAGTKEGVKKASEKLKSLGAKRIIELEVSAPFHCALMKPVEERMQGVLDAIDFSAGHFPIISNVSASPETDGKRIKDLLIKQITHSVRFTECIENLKQAFSAPSIFIELGPKNTLCGIVKKMYSEDRFYAVDTVDDLEKFTLENQ